MPARLPAGLVTQADHLWTGGPQRGPFPVARLPYLVNVPDLPSQLGLLAVEVCAGEQLLVHLALPLGPSGDGLSACDSQLHVLDHLLLLLQQLAVLDLGAQSRGTSHHIQLNHQGTHRGDVPRGERNLGA